MSSEERTREEIEAYKEGFKDAIKCTFSTLKEVVLKDKDGAYEILAEVEELEKRIEVLRETKKKYIELQNAEFKLQSENEKLRRVVEASKKVLDGWLMPSLDFAKWEAACQALGEGVKDE